ncbi:MAG TPA: MauE/DoxX family redox-associated membrane protein [Syntrophobacteraceae bacterium]|jgi:uncharacterized membrane protein YphA (DoxX/SURF4 family)|nr:MauE/DoxX family redox-associated membrane protein [Syntrophobacteraceae bacterium]
MVLGGVFILASLQKIYQPFSFAKTISNYQVLPDKLVNPAAIILPWIELILGSLLALGKWLPGAVALANFLLLAFFSALVFNAVRGLNIDCGCFFTATTEKASIVRYLIRDAFFLLLGGYLWHGTFIKPSHSNPKRH